jgi:phage-related holin
MCFLLNLLLFLVASLAFLVNFFIGYLYRQRLADCIFPKKRGFLRNIFVVHPLELYFTSILWAIASAFTFLEFFVSPKPFKVFYLFFVSAFVTYLYFRLRGKLLNYTTPPVADYLLLRYLPLLVSFFGTFLYAVYLYNSSTVGDWIPNPDAEQYIKELYARYGWCHIAGSLIVLIKLWNYAIGSLLLSTLKWGEDIYFTLWFFLFLKEGLSVWVLTTTIVGTVVASLRLFGSRFWA